MTFQLDDVALLVLVAGGTGAVVRTRRAGIAKGQRGRLRELGWCAALLIICLSVMSSAFQLGEQFMVGIWLVVPVATAAVLAIRPALAARIVPLALIALGLFGYVAARDYVFNGGLLTYGLTAVGSPGAEADAILPQAYAFLLGGCWLVVRSADPVLASARRWLGGPDDGRPAAQLRQLALLPVVVALAGLLAPGLWLAS